MSYQWESDNARRRYEDACIEISNCNGRIYDLENQKRKKINQINQLNTEIKNTQTAFDGVKEIVKREPGLNLRVTAISNTTNEASENFRRMAESSNVSSKDLSVVYGDEISKTKAIAQDIMNTLKEKQAGVLNKLNDLSMQLNAAKMDLQYLENQLRTEKANLQSLQNTKRSAANDMEYYRRKAQEEE